jgi:hypothetical protein
MGEYGGKRVFRFRGLDKPLCYKDMAAGRSKGVYFTCDKRKMKNEERKKLRQDRSFIPAFFSFIFSLFICLPCLFLFFMLYLPYECYADSRNSCQPPADH